MLLLGVWRLPSSIVGVRIGRSADERERKRQDFAKMARCISIAGHQAVTALCKEVNLDPRPVELGHLILFNLEFLTR